MSNINTKIQAVPQVNIKKLSIFISLSAIITLLPLYFHIQWATGPLVNALLILVLFFVGLRSAIILCAIPSIMALSGGLLPIVLAPMIPFVILSNIIYIIIIDWFYLNIKDNVKGYWIGIFSASALKFLFLFFSTNLVMNLILDSKISNKVAEIFSWPQFVTAFAGGIIAWILLKSLKRI